MGKITLFIDADNPASIDLGRSLLSCIRTLDLVRMTQLGDPVLPRTFATGRDRVEAFVFEYRGKALHLAIAVANFLSTLVRFRSTLPATLTTVRIPKGEKNKPLLLVVKGESLLLPASVAKQRDFFQQILSAESQSSAEHGRKKDARKKTSLSSKK